MNLCKKLPHLIHKIIVNFSDNKFKTIEIHRNLTVYYLFIIIFELLSVKFAIYISVTSSNEIDELYFSISRVADTDFFAYLLLSHLTYLLDFPYSSYNKNK